MSGFRKDKVFIIAEAGVNHNGNLDMAYKLIDVGVEAGVDAVKFQTGQPDLLVAKWAQKAKYQEVTTGANESQLDMIKKITFDYEVFDKLKAYAEKKGVIFFSTPFELNALKYLLNLGMDIIKIPSGEITNLPLLRAIARSSASEIIVSTGMASMADIADALRVLIDAGVSKEKLTVLHCNTEYPTPYEDVNLHAMNSIMREFGVRVGYSDHTPGIEVSVAAVALGAKVIEKHFTLDRNLPGPDHKASLEPNELKELVRCIRNIEMAISGDGRKIPSPSEQKNTAIARKSIMAAKLIRKGEIFSNENLIAKRPALGVSPMRWDEFIGRPAGKDYEADELIRDE
jgi:N,N'-diacetyllegionaminate synthase